MKRVWRSILAAVAVAGIPASASTQPYGAPPTSYGAPPRDWGMIHRLQWTQGLIEQARRAGAIDDREYRRAQFALDDIQRQMEWTSDRQQGRPNEPGEPGMEARLNQVIDQIHWLRQFDAHRPW